MISSENTIPANTIVRERDRRRLGAGMYHAGSRSVARPPRGVERHGVMGNRSVGVCGQCQRREFLVGDRWGVVEPLAREVARIVGHAPNLRRPAFITFDLRQGEAARRLGLRVLGS